MCIEILEKCKTAKPEIIKKDNFDIVVTDLKLPIMSGIELLEKIKEHDSTTGRQLLSVVQ